VIRARIAELFRGRDRSHGPAPLALGAHVALAAIACALVTVGSAALVAPLRRPTALVAAAALGATVGIALGVGQAALARVLRAPWAALLRAVSWDARTSRDPERDRAPVVALHAAGVALVLSLAAFGAGLWVWLDVISTVQRKSLTRELTIVGAVGLAVVAAALYAALFGALGRLVAAIDRRWVLPRPASPAVRRLLYAAAPLAAACGLLLDSLSKTLGAVALPFWLGLAVAVEIALAAIASLGAPLASKAPRLPRGVGLGLALAALAATAVLGERLVSGSKQVAAAAETADGIGLALRILRAATDVDRDGASSLYGDGDCAAFARSVHPGAVDLSANGVDENCDGRDGPSSLMADDAARFADVFATPPAAGHHVLWVIVDAMRADHTSLLGYAKATTPYLEQLAQDAAVFEQAFAQAPTTMLSVPSMMASLNPDRITWEHGSGRLQPAQAHVMFAERAKEQGYGTYLVGSYFFQKYLPGLQAGYDQVAFVDDKAAGGSADAAVAAALGFLNEARQDGRPFFMTLYFAEPHEPYEPHPEAFPSFGAGKTAVFDQEIANADRYLGMFLNVLEHDPEIWDKLVIVVVADHGEEFREHGATGHALSCHVEVSHVPLLLKAPGVPPQRVKNRVSLVDVTPTLIELLGFPRPDDREIDGRSLLSFTNKKHPPEDRPVYCSIVSQWKNKEQFYRRSIRYGDLGVFEDVFGTGKTRAYDIMKDSKEQRPIPIDEAGPSANELLELMRARATGNLGEMAIGN
jgi:arylsulfatase A-like enzyme